MKTINDILNLAENICKVPGEDQSQSDKNKLRIASRFAIDAVQRWISVTERLPQPDIKVFVEYEIVPECTDFTALELSDEEVWHDNGNDFKFKVIKWRPINYK
jgi:hypothetical protein